MGLGGMDTQIENTEKMATGLQHVVAGATAGDSALLACSVAISCQFLLYDRNLFNPICCDRGMYFPLRFHCQLLSV